MVVYPRWRGEHFSNLKPVGSLFGLSPLARGTQSNRYFKWPAVRFIPAGAGNSPGDWRNNPDHAVYPRWRGELFFSRNSFSWSSGLSPLARGTRVAAAHRWRTHRFIPAGAGNSLTRRARVFLCPVYPRWRGELYPALNLEIKLLGLSPLARGTHKP